MSMAVVVSVVVTAMVVALSWTAGVQSQITGSRSKSDEAYFAAEAGAQHVAWYVRNGSLPSSTGTLTGNVVIKTNYADPSEAGKTYTYTASWAPVILKFTVVGIDYVFTSSTVD